MPIIVTSLFDAVESNNIHVVKRLIDKGANVNFFNTRGEMPLHIAVKKGYLEVAKILINKGANINDIDSYAHFAKKRGGTLLHWAARHHWLQIQNSVYNGELIIRFLVENGANVNATENDGRTPLCLLVKHNGSVDIIKFLIEKGANLNNSCGCTPLFWAFYIDLYGNPERANLLIEMGSDVNGCINYCGDSYDDMKTPLHLVKNLSTAKLLIEKGANVNIVDKHGNTPLHLVRHFPIAKILVEKGANVNAINSNGSTPLHLAQNFAIAKFLIEKGANPNSTNNEGYTPFHLALNISIAELLIEQDVDFKAITKDGKTVLHTIAETDALGDTKFKNVKWLIDFFIQKGIDVNVTDHYGNTPLHLCEELNNVEVAERLLENGADINAMNNYNKKPGYIQDYTSVFRLMLESIHKLFIFVKDGEESNKLNSLVFKSKAINCVLDNTRFTLLHYAVQKSRAEIVRFLLKEKRSSRKFVNNVLIKINVNACSRDNWTPLHYAAQKNNKYIIRLLLESGAAYNIETIQGNTPLELTTNNAIKDLFTLVKKLFEAVKVGDHEQVIHCIKEEKAIINAVENDGSSALHWAIIRGYQNIVTFLLENRANATLITNEGSTTLHFAACKNDQTIFHTLLKCIKKTGRLSDLINAKTTDGTTALHIATKNGSLEIVKSLLKCGAAYNTKNNEGRRPYDLSKSQDLNNLLKLIQELFTNAENDSFQAVNRLQSIELDEFIAVTNTCDNQGNTLTEILKVSRNPSILEKLSKIMLSRERELLLSSPSSSLKNISEEEVEEEELLFGLYD